MHKSASYNALNLPNIYAGFVPSPRATTGIGLQYLYNTTVVHTQSYKHITAMCP